jgi:hypothetical protein
MTHSVGGKPEPGKNPCPFYPLRGIAFFLTMGVLLAGPAYAQLFQNLQTLSQSVPVGSGQKDPVTGERLDGPRWVCAADFDQDGNPIRKQRKLKAKKNSSPNQTSLL